MIGFTLLPKILSNFLFGPGSDKPLQCSWVNVFRLRITTHQWVSCKGAATQTAALASWKVLNWPLSPRWSSSCGPPVAQDRGLCTWAAESLGHHLLSRALTTAPTSLCYLLAKRVWKGAQGPHNLPWVQKGVVSSPCTPGGSLGAQEFLEFLGKLKCAELSPAVQARTRLRWSLLSHFRTRFWQLLYEKPPLQPSMSRSPFSVLWCASCDISLLSLFLSCGFLDLAGLNNWLFSALTPPGAAQSMDKLTLQLRDRGTPPACRFPMQFCVKRRLTSSTVW